MSPNWAHAKASSSVWREDVHHRRTGDCVWCECERGLWNYLLGNNFVLTQKGLTGLVKPFGNIIDFLSEDRRP
jgi:hypothetical protein